MGLKEFLENERLKLRDEKPSLPPLYIKGETKARPPVEDPSPERRFTDDLNNSGGIGHCVVQLAFNNALRCRRTSGSLEDGFHLRRKHYSTANINSKSEHLDDVYASGTGLEDSALMNRSIPEDADLRADSLPTDGSADTYRDLRVGEDNSDIWDNTGDWRSDSTGTF
jgi:hypothetical protein